ncbi:MAG TPA: TlpA disulfide reductase family protein [Geothrix sp.]|nr:TlpA disulfide reductase family protein [Geothrix sp.]
MSDAYVSESRWRTPFAVGLMAVGLLLVGVVLVRGVFGGGAAGASQGTDVSKVAFLDAEGARHTVGDYRGKVLVVDVWATWCPPCRKSLPEVAELQRGEGDTYAVLPISVDRGGWGDVNPFLQQNPQLGLKAFLPDGDKGLEPFGEIPGIPTTIIIDRHGKVVSRWAGYGEGMAKAALDKALKAP